MTASEKKQLMAAACKVRMGAIKGVHAAKAGHPGGSLSAAGVPGFGTVGGFNHAHTHLAGCDLQLQTFFLCHITHQTPCSSLP